MRHSFPLAMLVCALAPAAPAAPGGSHGSGELIAHEWGTFTSVAGEDGRAVEWRPYSAQSDLPAFVERLRLGPKASISGTVRMETPVIYFYAAHEMSVDVKVTFRQGVITEWYPRAVVTPAGAVTSESVRHPGFQGRITWAAVSVAPFAAADFPTDSTSSHYYAARATHASPLLSGSERERFLFYRGVGSFPAPVAAVVADDGRIDVATLYGEPLGTVVLFENRAGRIAYDVQHIADASATLAPGPPAGDLDSLTAQLATMLVAAGLYPMEANAMLATWRDSWFEEGTRVLYVVPRRMIDAILPLEIDPPPTEIIRVFIGRIELITPGTLVQAREALSRRDDVTLQKYGRFLGPIRDRLQ